MKFASSILSSVLSKIGEYLVDSSIHKANYLLRFKNIVEDLKKEDENLRLTHDRIHLEVKRAKRNAEEIEKDVEKWLMDVHNILEDIRSLEDDIQVKKTFLCGRCPNWGWRYKLSRRAVRKMSDISKLRDGEKFDRVSHSTTLPEVEAPKDFMTFKPTKHAFSWITEVLKNDKINMVGLYGMGGVGKTTLAKVVGDKAKEEKLFDEVVMVTVTQNPNFKNIQGQIADSLGFELIMEETIETRAQRLCLRLKIEKKILIILDDVWAILDLTTIGIPFGDDHKGCAIFLTTRLKQVCIDMSCKWRIQLDILNEEEGLILFRKQAGIYSDSPTLNVVAKEVVRECRGLPIAIVTIASALREKTIDEWKVVPKKLKMSKLMDIEKVDQNVYACLKLSFDYLKAEETKFCFLLCSLFPEDYKIDLEELLRYVLGLNLYQDADSIEESRNQLHVAINNLKSLCLLLDAKDGCVKMHDVVRDVALWITSKVENVFMVKAGMRLAEWPKHDGLEQCTAISLMNSKIKMLPDRLVCPKLKVLKLHDVKVSDEFFEEMKSLKVASLTCVDLSLKSLQSLTNLVTLQLIDCELRDNFSLKRLAKLEILSLQGSTFFELPEELRELSKLRMLDLTYCSYMKRIPVNVISRLSQLEELYINNASFEAWEVEGTSAEGRNASLSELSNLYCLSILSLSIKVHHCLPKDFTLSSKLLRYNIRVNDEDHIWFRFPYDSYPKSRLLKIRGIEATSLFAFKALYENVEYLELKKIMGCCQNMVPSIDETGLNELKSLSLESFDELECIIDMTQQQDVPSTAFSNLVELFVDSVGLREICSGGRPPRGFLKNLETLKIQNCNGLSCLFPRMLIQILQKLKKVTVENCGELEDVFQLEALCYAKENSFLISSLASLNSIWLKNQRYICKGPTQQVSLRSLTIVQVYRCNKLKYLFTLSVARSLLQLEELMVTDCGSLEHIVTIKAEENVPAGGGGNYIVLPKLRKLHIAEIEKFINFCSEDYYSIGRAPQELLLYLPLNSIPSFVAEVEDEDNVSQTSKEKLRVLDQWCNTALAQLRYGLHNLEELKVRGCRVQMLFQLEGLEQELSLPSLKVIELEYLPKLECLCKGPKHLLSMQNLKRLAVNNCCRLRYMFSATLARNLLQLEELIILRCGELEQILVEDDAEHNQTLLKNHPQRPLLFPNLLRVDISSCDKLKCLFPVSIAHLLSLQNLTTLELDNCHRLTHLFSSTLTRNLLQLERIDIVDCGELEQIIVKDNTKDHVQFGLFPNLSYISVKRCGKLKTLLPVYIAQWGLRKLRNIYIQIAFQLEELFGCKDEVGMIRDIKIELPLLEVLTLRELASLVNFCPSDYRFIFPSLLHLWVTKCPKITTRFSIDQNGSIHTEAEALQMGKEDVNMEQSPPETTVEIYCRDYDALWTRLPHIWYNDNIY